MINIDKTFKRGFYIVPSPKVTRLATIQAVWTQNVDVFTIVIVSVVRKSVTVLKKTTRHTEQCVYALCWS